jgi:hypothetical protein
VSLSRLTQDARSLSIADNRVDLVRLVLIRVVNRCQRSPLVSGGSRSRCAAFSSSLIQAILSFPALTRCRIRPQESARPSDERSMTLSLT